MKTFQCHRRNIIEDFAGFSERQLIFQVKVDVLGVAAEGVKNLAISAANLIDVVTTLTKEGSELLIMGIGGAKTGLARLQLWSEKKWGGAAPLNPKMTRMMQRELGPSGSTTHLFTVFNTAAGLTGDAKKNAETVDLILNHDVAARYFQFKKEEISSFHLPQIEYLKEVADEINNREKIELETRARRAYLEAQIETLKGRVGDPSENKPSVHLRGSGAQVTDQELLTDLTDELKGYKEAMSMDIDMDEPGFAKKEFPPKSGNYVKVFYPGSAKKKVNLKQLAQVLAVQVDVFSFQIQKDLGAINKEQKKHAYRRDEMLASLEIQAAADKDAAGLSIIPKISATKNQDMLAKVREKGLEIAVQAATANSALVSPNYFKTQHGSIKPISYVVKGKSVHERQRDRLRALLKEIK